MSAPFGPLDFQNAEPVGPSVDAYLEAFVGVRREKDAAPHKRTRVLSLDYETYSEADLPKTGASVYARHPSTEVLMLAYRFLGDDEEPKQWVPATGEPMPADLRLALLDPTVTLAAWNAPFEAAITEHTLGIEIEPWRWMDIMALAFSLSLPGKLETAGKVLRLGEDKQKIHRGKLLIRKFCKPRKPTKNKPWTRETAETAPEDWSEFLHYNRQDVVAEQAIYKRIRRYQMPDHEWALWHLDQKINNAGIPINVEAVKAAVHLAQKTTERDLAEMRELTGLANPNSNQQILPWLREAGYPFLDLKKGHVERAWKAAVENQEQGIAEILGDHPDLPRVLELRLRVSKASVKKFPALLLATDEDRVLRGCHQFAGAGRTWRWSGRRFQPQNLSKPAKYLEDRVAECVHDVEHLTVEEIWEKYENPMEVLVASVRPVVQAPEGHLLIDADLSAIENVVLGWLAGDDKILRVFREDRDPYIDFATRMFKMSYDEIAEIVANGDKSMRTTAKPGVLGCGYMLSAGETRENRDTGEIEATGLLGYGWNMGVDLTPEMADLSVKTFRKTYKKVVQFWWDLDEAARKAIKTKQPQRVGKLVFDRKGPFMRIKLPSGRYLHYVRPALKKRKTPWGAWKMQITYEQMDNGRWKRVSTHPGKLAENVTQAVARDLLAHGMTLADAAGLDLRLHVHDQLVGVSPEDEADEQLALLIRCMTTRPSWADDKLPLKADGFTSPIFLKD